MPFLRASLFAACLVGSLTAAQAGSAPAAACAGAGDLTSELVLGHFRGGKIFRVEGNVPMISWADEYSCFTSRRMCESWQRQMNVAYRNVEGDRTCLPLR